MTELGKKIEEMRHGHRSVPSYRKMSLEAGLSENAVYRIVKYGQGARPETLWALCVAWSRTPEERDADYRALMVAAGHQPPTDAAEPTVTLTATERRILAIYHVMTTEQRRAVSAAVQEKQVPGEIADLLVNGLGITDAEVQQWMRDGQKSEEQSSVPESWLSEDERLLIKRHRLLAPDMKAMIALGLGRFTDDAEAAHEIMTRLSGVAWRALIQQFSRYFERLSPRRREAIVYAAWLALVEQQGGDVSDLPPPTFNDNNTTPE